MENKKNVKQNFLQRFSNFNFLKRKEKKKRDGKKKKKEKRRKRLINYHTPFHEYNNSNILYLFVSDRKISDMILIIRSNFS